MIEFDRITKNYNGRAAVDEVSFTIEPHSIAAIVGTSGSGKTTLLRMVNRLEEPTSGEIRIDGQSILDEPGHELRRRIGYVIQQHGLFPHRTVGENIATAIRTNFPAGSNSASAWRGPLPPDRTSS
ncbi:choline transport ATP-binding protein OpuBA [Brucella abortus F10/05-11]|nr:choline transport ATP-binding protein OpuBA [Brucella abortus F10/05-11]